ncbi:MULTISPECIES: helix-turn-helix domain-containing protein [unclassified Actinomyces]|uniref:helix-turn-helix domain-containing protein n=1 Tax=unclassified Actinomyces TaxID=2609248 RepID=UPI002016D959|nr:MULTISPECIES: helix-turn-helix domain-containing protein [unclassified Actinomyces]MCL3778642.1 helix-turn-helix domain-containing protein [Actinomyces sp. AC-20-1]MCL3790567.1 helix-turn-helix domain-containing protein [Actinomyces sp. 187325]MCL3792888.1 helix-turn-helix domain-containing protein [Actinomyces sp. 186855]MCL3795282.1 helix-turn-helix domain-containing protein [Actinomyces sp. 217892]
MSSTFLTIADVAERLQLSAQGVRALIMSGDLPAIQVGARHLWRIPEDAFGSYVEAQLARTRSLVAAGRLDDED